ncbi:MAG: acyltransferase [Microbacteriaceae bacterium]|nr:MAG: acyltransferase [Microbacteriaceae bacterium]
MSISRVVALSDVGAWPAALPSGSATRSGGIDAVRVFGIAAVVAGHCLTNPLVRPLFYTWHVPLFFFLAGYFWNHNRALDNELATRTRTLAVPYAMWFVLIAIPFVALDSSLEGTTWSRLFSPFANGQSSAMPYTTFWFVAVLFVCTLLLRCLWLLPRPVVWSIAIAGAVLGYWAGDALARTPLSIGSALPCLIFMMLGTTARTARSHIRAPARTGLGLIVISAATITVGVSAPVDIKQGDYGTPVLSIVVAALIAFGLVLTAEACFEHLPARVGRIATQLSYGGFMVVLTHPLVLWLILTFGPTAPGWVLFVVCSAVPWLAAWLALRTPLSSWLTGVRCLTARCRPLGGTT